jgi:hypothetical protein
MANGIFSVLNLVALVGWVLLAALPGRRWAERLGFRVVPALLAASYVAIIAGSWGQSPGGFSSLPDVAKLFENPWLLLAGWVHYLAFDLLIGGWIVRDAQARGLAHRWLLPSLALTFLFGPAGWLSYLGLRLALQRRAGGGPAAAGSGASNAA